MNMQTQLPDFVLDRHTHSHMRQSRHEHKFDGIGKDAQWPISSMRLIAYNGHFAIDENKNKRKRKKQQQQKL